MMTLLNWYRALPRFRGKYRIGRWFFKALIEKAYPVEVVVNRRLRFHLPNSIENIGKEIILNGAYEEGSVRSIVKELKKSPNPVFFDIGANIGAIAIPVNLQLASVEIHAFEASPATYKFLRKNFLANNLPTDKLLNKLVFSSDGKELKFYDSAKHYGKSSLAPTYTREAVTVYSITIDDYCNQNSIDKIDLVKVDVQGYEIEVFKGMRSILQEKKVEAIFFEFEDWAEEAAGFNPGDSQEFLIQQGYHVFTESGIRIDIPVRKGSMMLWAKPCR